jgi:glycosyltransferase involved in cell wall biosynthesis
MNEEDLGSLDSLSYENLFGIRLKAYRNKISVVVISSRVGKTSADISHSFVFDEAYRLARKGVEVHVVRSKVEGESIFYGISFHGIKRKYDIQALNLLVRNITCYPLISLVRKPPALYWENLYALNVSKVVERNDVNLIHAHFAYPEGLVGYLTKRRTGKPLIVTIHGYDILVEPSIGYGVRLSKRIDCLVRRVLDSADIVIAASIATFNEAKNIVNDVNKVHLIPNGVDTQRFNPNLDGSDIKKRLGIEGRKVIFTLRHHEPTYGLEYLIRAAPIVTKEEDVVFVIGGDGPLISYHKRLATDLGVKGKMIFTGKIPRSETPYYYAMSDIVVVPSLQEAFGLVVSEAMSSGKPVIGTKVGGIPDQIIDGYNGFLVQPKKPEEIAEKILWLINNPNEARRMGMNGRKIVEEKFDINKRIEKIISLYERLLSNGCT